MKSTVFTLCLAPDRVIRELEKRRINLQSAALLSHALFLSVSSQGQTDRHVALSVSGSRVSVADKVISSRCSLAFALSLSASQRRVCIERRRRVSHTLTRRLYRKLESTPGGTQQGFYPSRLPRLWPILRTENVILL